jgi:hypothetical protein
MARLFACSSTSTFLFEKKAVPFHFFYGRVLQYMSLSSVRTELDDLVSRTANASSLTIGTISNAVLPPDIVVPGNVTADTIHANVQGEIVFLDGHLDMLTLSAQDITLAGASLVDEINAIKNTDLSSFSVQDGTVSAPSLAFQSDRNTGVFRPGSDTIALSAGGTAALTANATTTVVPGTLSASDVLVGGTSATTLKTDTWLQSTDGRDRVYYESGGATRFNGNVEATGAFVGDGRFLSNVASSNASTLTSGTLSNNVLPQHISFSGNITADTVHANIDFSHQTVDGELVLLDGQLNATTLSVDDITLAGESLVAKITDLETRLAALE